MINEKFKFNDNDILYVIIIDLFMNKYDHLYNFNDNDIKIQIIWMIWMSFTVYLNEIYIEI